MKKKVNVVLPLCLAMILSMLTFYTETAAEEGTGVSHSRREVEMLAKLMYAEAGGDVIEDRIGVAEVVKNRVISSGFPNTVEDVVTQRRQFANYTTGKLTDENLMIAEEVLSGKLSILNEDVLFFRNPIKCSAERGDDWNSKPFEVALGLHDFYSSPGNTKALKKPVEETKEEIKKASKRYSIDIEEQEDCYKVNIKIKVGKEG